MTVQGSLQQWLGELIEVETVAIEPSDSQLHITVQYVIRRDRERARAQFTRRLA